RRPPALERGADDPDHLRRRAGADELEDLLADELEQPACPGGLEETERAVQRRPRRRQVGEERALDVGEDGRTVLVGASGELLDPAGEPGKVVCRSLQRRE